MAEYEDCIVFLLAKAYQKAHSLMKKKLLPYGVTPVQHLILQALSEEKNPSPAEISEKTLIDSATLSGVMDRMAEAGLIRKEENPEDRRSIRVSLSPKGRGLYRQIADIRQAVNEELTGVYSLEEKLLFKRMLRDLKV